MCYRHNSNTQDAEISWQYSRSVNYFNMNELNMNVQENTTLPSLLLVTSGTAVASDPYVCMRQLSFKSDHSLLIQRWVFHWLTKLVFHINGSCWSFIQKCQSNISIYNHYVTALQIHKSLLKANQNRNNQQYSYSLLVKSENQFPSGQSTDPAFRQWKIKEDRNIKINLPRNHMMKTYNMWI